MAKKAMRHAAMRHGVIKPALACTCSRFGGEAPLDDLAAELTRNGIEITPNQLSAHAAHLKNEGRAVSVERPGERRAWLKLTQAGLDYADFIWQVMCGDDDDAGGES